MGLCDRAGPRFLEVGFGLYLETRSDDGVEERGLGTEGHPIFEYLFPRPVRDS